jgi:isocitrate dehydrogenase
MFDAIKAGKRVGAIYKEPTITPTLDQVKSMNLKKMWRSPNGAMRAGWNGERALLQPIFGCIRVTN